MAMPAIPEQSKPPGMANRKLPNFTADSSVKLKIRDHAAHPGRCPQSLPPEVSVGIRFTLFGNPI